MLAHTNEAQLSTRGTPAARSGRKRKYALASIGITTVAALAVGITVGPVANAATSKAKGKPIKVGSIASLTGGPSFPEAGVAVRAYFAEVNAKGGINGRPIDYNEIDDGFDTNKLAAAARQIVDQRGAVALVGSASVLDCAINGAYYDQKGIVSIPGVGILNQCFTTKSIAPTNTGQYTGLGVNIVFAVTTLKKTAPCVLAGAGNGGEEATASVVAKAEAQTGVKVKSTQFYPVDTHDFTAFLLKAKDAGCDVLMPAVSGPDLIALEKELTELGLRDKMPTVQLASGYNVAFGGALKDVADGLIANSEFLPFTGSGANDPGLAEFNALAKKYKFAPSAFGEGGYLAAKIFTKVVRGIKGDITAATVAKAFQSMKPIADPLLGTPYVFGPGATHQPNFSSRYVQLKNGVWEPITKEWTSLKG
jgi:branched-chain amino acid transport system substrate-binding protein